jgi:predicted DNA-binding protein (MmcQ/YjbR family)
MKQTSEASAMDEKSLRRLCAAWPGVTAEIKWDDDLIFMVAGKMFCGLCVKGAQKGKFAFKVEAERFLEFTDRPGIVPAPYMARSHWISLDDHSVLPRDELPALVRRAYELVREKLPRKLQRELADG